jgi:capsular exopolysaccharide synthesis family protein
MRGDHSWIDKLRTRKRTSEIIKIFRKEKNVTGEGGHSSGHSCPRKQKNESSMLALDPSKGVSTTLIKKTTWAECVQSTGLENLDFFPAGPHPPNPSELLLNGEFTNLLEELKEAYDFIVIDTPPVGLVTDGIMAMKRADLSIYVIRANYSKKDFLNTLSRLLNIHKLTNLAVVLNALPTTGKTYGYGYYEDKPKRKGWRDLVKV